MNATRSDAHRAGNEVHALMQELGAAAVVAAAVLAQAPTAQKNQALMAAAGAIRAHGASILDANSRDIEAAHRLAGLL